MLPRLKPDAIVLDNVVMFPAIAAAGVPWVRVVSCAETELPDAAVPPYLSGLAAENSAGRAAFDARYRAAMAPAHERYNRFSHGARARAAAGDAVPRGVALAQPAADARNRPPASVPSRSIPADLSISRAACAPKGPFDPPVFPKSDGPLVYMSFGSLGAMDVDLIERMLAVFATLPARFLVNVGGFRDTYRAVPDNVYLDSWFPQPSVVAKADLFIHHGGNNSFCEALRFGVPVARHALLLGWP